MQENISYEEIRSHKLQDYGTKIDNWIWIVIKQYKDRTHFLFELLQNAEDAGASHVILLLYRDKFVIEHDGNIFTKDNVESITRIAESDKKKAGDGSIGRFGIGFKSVYAYTTKPSIYSGKYAFEIRDFVFPYEIEHKNIHDDYTRIEIPFDNMEVSSEKAFMEIAKALNEQITISTLLFLNNIDELEIIVENHSNRVSISKEERFLDKSANFIDTNIIYRKIDCKTEKIVNELSEDYLVITDAEKEAVKLAFKVEKNENEKELVPVKNTNIFTFFPTDKESHQNFYIHAPFDTTPARDNIVEDSECNRKFVESICMMLHGGYCWMRDNGYLSISGLNATFPIYEYPKNTIFHAIYQEAIRIIDSNEPILPTNNKRVFKRKSEIIMPDNKRIVDVFSDDDMQRLCGDRKIFWIAKDISTDAYQDFREFLKRQFEFKTYSWPEIIRKLRDANTFLERKEKKWFIELFSSIGGVSVGNEVKLQDIPFVRLKDGKHICAYDGSNPLVYLNNPESCENRIDTYFLEEDIIKNFYAHNLKIPNYDIVRVVLDEIMPKYAEKNNIKFHTNKYIRENIQDLKNIKMAISADASIVKQLSNCYLLTDGRDWYKPSEIHVSNNFGSKPEYQLVKEICNLHFLTTEYTDEVKINDERFFVTLGCPNTLAKEEITSAQYLTYVKKYIGKEIEQEIRQRIFSKKHIQGIEWNTVFEGFPKIFENMDFEKSKKLADFLNKTRSMFTVSGELFAADDKSFAGKQADSMTVYSAIGLMISYYPWIYTKDKRKVAVVDIHQREIDDEYNKRIPLLLKVLPFKVEDEDVEKILSRFEDDETREVMKTLLTDPEKQAEIIRALKKQKIKELKGKQKKSPTELIKELGESGGKKTSGYDSEDSLGVEPVTNVERREKKLEESFSESMDHIVSLKLATLKYTYQEKIDPREKEFLEQQYRGFCQICDEHIQKRDGTYHFQAINMLKTTMLDNKYINTLGLGWNSLCLCPNCAAKYMYGLKDLSMFEEQIQNIEVESGDDELINIEIGLQGEYAKIRYTPKHFIALQTAMKVFKE